MVVRLSENMLSVDGYKVLENKKNGTFSSFTGEKISLFRLQALYLFVDNEERIFYKKFVIKVDNLIKKLIYDA